MKIIITTIIILTLIFLTGCEKAVCGNDIVEEGETMQTCCKDTGCLGEQICKDNSCIEPTCGECQYLEDHICVSYECCKNDDCNYDKICENNQCILLDCGECQHIEEHECLDYECCENDACQNNEICKIHECIKLDCDDCQYIKNHKCLDYECCEDSDCDDNNISTNDECINPRTTSASCSNIVGDECSDNSDCDDEDVSTKDICLGTPKKCSNTEITQCIDGDDYCPSECTHNNDDDCEIQVIDCGSTILSEETIGNAPNFDCFIEASENCDPAKLLSTVTIELFGLVITTTTLMELKGIEPDKCIYYQRTESQSVRFSDEIVQQMLDSGITQEEIDEQEQIANDSAQEVVGMERTCKFNTEDLTAMLNNWKQGTSSTEDWDVAECEGDY